jgi:signal transduction histidine kinase
MFYNEIGITIIVSTMMFLLLVAGVVVTIFIANRRNAKQEMKITQMQLDYEKELRMVQYEVQEQVLVNIGRELHDNIGQLLTVMHMQLEQHKFLNPDAGPLLPQLGSTLGDTIQEVRRLGKSLNSDLFEAQGLINTIQQEVLRLRQLNNYEVQWTYDIEPLLSKDQKVIAFRIFQEVLNNILKHSGAKKIEISLTGTEGFRITISDDGRGFYKEATMQSAKGSGLKNMIKRAELANLTLNFNSIIGKGTTFILETTK